MNSPLGDGIVVARAPLGDPSVDLDEVLSDREEPWKLLRKEPPVPVPLKDDVPPRWRITPIFGATLPLR